jgi:hypothetical protein
MRSSLLFVSALLLASHPAEAAQRCQDLPSPIYVAGASSASPLLKALAPLLLKDADQATVVYQPRGSCAGVEALVRDTDPNTCQQGACLFGPAVFYTLDGGEKVCDLPAAGAHPHVALSDVFPESCPALGGGAPRGIVDLPGPISPLALVAPRQSPEAAIHAQEAHFVFGFGMDGGVLPWTVTDSVVTRDERSGGQVLLGQHIQVPPGRFKGTQAADPADLITRLLAGDPRPAIGFMPTTLADARRGDLKILAFQALGQRGAFWPDRAASSFDKRNVRDGHYPLWGYLHVIGRADPVMPDRPRSVLAGRLADLVQGKANVPGVDLLEVQVRAGLVPACAMRVSRTRDTAPLAPYTPPAPCGCWFEKAVPQGQARCTACTDDKACGAGRCRRGFCEDR